MNILVTYGVCLSTDFTNHPIRILSGLTFIFIPHFKFPEYRALFLVSLSRYTVNTACLVYLYPALSAWKGILLIIMAIQLFPRAKRRSQAWRRLFKKKASWEQNNRQNRGIKSRKIWAGKGVMVPWFSYDNRIEQAGIIFCCIGILYSQCPLIIGCNWDASFV